MIVSFQSLLIFQFDDSKFVIRKKLVYYESW